MFPELIEVLNCECVEILTDLLELFIDKEVLPLFRLARHAFALTTLE